MIKETTNYAQFKFRDDNRKQIDPAHVRKLAASIKMRNLLEMKPILVNKNFEVIDGQHRLLAAQQVGVPVFYSVEEKIEAKDLLLLNLSKSWSTTDYVNYYAKNGYEEYKKLEEFAKFHQLAITLAVNLLSGRNKQLFEKIRQGEFKFLQNEATITELSNCKEIRDKIVQLLTSKHWTFSSRFWKALIDIVKNPYYNHQKMLVNVENLITKIGQRASYNAYLDMLANVHNFRNQSKITIGERMNDE